MKQEELTAIRLGAEMQNMKPYLVNEIDAMQKAVVNSVLAAVNGGSLTPEMALSKWMEYIAYMKLTQRVDQRIRIGQDIGIRAKDSLDFDTTIV